MNLTTEPYPDQLKRWPRSGQHILAQFDERSIVVYQAYNRRIGEFAARHGYFGGEFSLGRMSWIKPNFLWMMYRSGWGTKPDQETTLAVRIKREAFDFILSLAVHSSFVPEIHPDHPTWRRTLAESSVRLQWDPDHDPAGRRETRRAIQLGMRDEILRRYSREWIVEIEDLSEFVASQRDHAQSGNHALLVTPAEGIYPVADRKTAMRLGISSSDIGETEHE